MQWLSAVFPFYSEGLILPSVGSVSCRDLLTVSPLPEVPCEESCLTQGHTLFPGTLTFSLIDMEDKAWVPHTNSWQFQRVIQASDLSIWLAETFVETLTQLTFPFTYSYFFPFPSVVPGAPLINLLCDNLYLKSASWELNLQDIQLWGRKTSQPQRKKEKRRNKWALKLVINQNEVKQVKSDPSLELFPHVIKSDISSKRNSI